jgi:hypothetical protein
MFEQEETKISESGVAGKQKAARRQAAPRRISRGT